MASFNGFTDAQMDRISQKLGYTGPKHKFSEFLASNPAANRAYSGLLNKVNMKFNRGGVVKMQAGGYTPEQIREYTKGMSDKQIAEAANQFNVSAGDLAKAFNTTTNVIKTRAGEAGVNLTNTAPRMISGNEIEAAGGIDAFRKQLNVPAPQTPPPVSPQTPVTPVMPDPSQYGLTPGPDFTQYADSIYESQQDAKQVSQDILNAGGLNNYLAQSTLTPEQQKNIRDYAQRSANTFEAGVSPQEIQQQYAQDLLALPEGMRAEAEKIFAEELEANRPGVLEQFRQAIATPPPPAPVEPPVEPPVGPSAEMPEGFNAQEYLEMYPDVAQAGIDPLQHYLMYGQSEGRSINKANFLKPELYDAYMQNMSSMVASGSMTAEDAFSQMLAEVNRLRGEGYTVDEAELSRSLNAAFSGNTTPESIKQFIDTGGAGADAYTLTPGVPQTISEGMLSRALTGARPVDAEGNEVGVMTPAQIAEQSQQIIGSGVGQVGTAPTVTGAPAPTTAQAPAPAAMTTVQAQAATATPDINQALQSVAPAQGSVSQNAQVQAAQMSPTATQVGTIGPAQIAEAQQVQAPQSRTLQEGELVTGVANAQQAAAFAEQVTAATADPTAKATVQGQLADLMTQFEDGQVPAWAAGAMRQANATLAARGLGASSIAGQAIVQAAMEASLPIASADAQTFAQFELTNLSNRQARAMLAAQQRATFIGQEFDQEFQARVSNAAKISDIANLNFNAQQQIALENAQLAQTVDLANLSNQQALVMAEASQIANLEVTNLSNRQQAAVQNAQSFLQMDLTNLSNQQQTDMFKAQSVVQGLLSDQAAENAARQFNASSENQTNQFFSNLGAQISQFNATQTNAMSQFNAEQSNIIGRFNAELESQRDQFNAQNQLVIEQSNATWRRELSTANTAAENLANQFNAQAILDISNTAYAQLWQAYRDDMEWAWSSGENERDRMSQLALRKLDVDAAKYSADAKEDGSFATALGAFAATVVANW